MALGMGLFFMGVMTVQIPIAMRDLYGGSAPAITFALIVSDGARNLEQHWRDHAPGWRAKARPRKFPKPCFKRRLVSPRVSVHHPPADPGPCAVPQGSEVFE